MKLKIFLLIIFSLLLFAFYFNSKGQVGEWVWLHGSNTPNSLGNYGIQGLSSPLNDPPALYEPCEWTDLNGNFWLFGGGYGSVNADLWKYDPSINEWTWMKGSGIPFDTGSYGVQGISSPTNNPPNRTAGVPTWTDLNGNLWLFGGAQLGLGFLSDLWKYDISINEWTWVKGPNLLNQPPVFGIIGVPDPANNPQPRAECAAAWTDNAGNLWMIGGTNSANTLWRYNIATNQWTWMKGDMIPGNPVYGIQGVEDSLNTPGYRWAHTRWKDNLGMLWLFGGAGSGTNDLWRFNITTNNWTWMNGSNVSTGVGSYGTKCVVDSTNVPSGRYETRSAWTDQDGNFWLFGGAYDTPNTVKNDLWKYCVLKNRWVWISGSNSYNPVGDWGTLGVSSPTNKPNGRMGAVGWRLNNNLYFFGGLSTGGTDPYNDLWKFTIDTTCGVCPSSTNLNEINFLIRNIKIYPNPTKDKLIIEFNQDKLLNIEITLFNVLGEIVFSVTDKNILNEKSIDISSLPNAIYFIELNINGSRVMKKIVKE